MIFSAKGIAISVFVICFIVALFPLWVHKIAPTYEVGFMADSAFDPPKYYMHP